MTLQQLEYVVALDRHRHFVQAAEACGISQPTLSAMIQKLEEELGVRIFDRTKHPVEPTEMGRRIIRQAETALQEVHRISEQLDREKTQLAGELRLGVIPTVAPYLVPGFINGFQTECPSVALTVEEMRTKMLLLQLRSGELDMAILSTPLGDPDFLEIPLYYERFVAYFSPDEPHRALKPGDMPPDHLWVLQEGHCARNQVFNFCRSSGVYNHTYEAGSIDTLIKIVDRNGGYTVIPELHLPFLTAEQRGNVEPIEPPAVREISILIRRDYIRERMVNAVADVIKQLIPARMLDDHLRKFAIRL